MKTQLNNFTRLLGVAADSIVGATVAQAQVAFSEDFDSGPSAQWSNVRGGENLHKDGIHDHQKT